MVYIKEAHPTDEWSMPENVTDGVCYRQPRNLRERLAIARDFTTRMRWPMPILVDGEDNRANALYAGWPERIYVIDPRGRIVYKGHPGPFGFAPQELEGWLARHLSGRSRAA